MHDTIVYVCYRSYSCRCRYKDDVLKRCSVFHFLETDRTSIIGMGDTYAIQTGQITCKYLCDHVRYACRQHDIYFGRSIWRRLYVCFADDICVYIAIHYNNSIVWIIIKPLKCNYYIEKASFCSKKNRPASAGQ